MSSEPIVPAADEPRHPDPGPTGEAASAAVEGATARDDGSVSADAVEVEIGEVVDPSTVRHAPRFGAFLGAGVVLGLVIGCGLGGWWLSEFGQVSVKPGVTFTVIVLGATAVTTTIAGLVLVMADRRSLRR